MYIIPSGELTLRHMLFHTYLGIIYVVIGRFFMVIIYLHTPSTTKQCQMLPCKTRYMELRYLMKSMKSWQLTIHVFTTILAYLANWACEPQPKVCHIFKNSMRIFDEIYQPGNAYISQTINKVKGYKKTFPRTFILRCVVMNLIFIYWIK